MTRNTHDLEGILDPWLQLIDGLQTCLDKRIECTHRTNIPLTHFADTAQCQPFHLLRTLITRKCLPYSHYQATRFGQGIEKRADLRFVPAMPGVAFVVPFKPQGSV